MIIRKKKMIYAYKLKIKIKGNYKRTKTNE